MRTRRSSSFASRRGFTLLELLLATAVAAIVLLVINATFFSALRLHNTTHEKIDTDLVLQRALGIIRRDLAGLMLPTGGNGIVLAGALQTTESSSSVNGPTGDRVSPDFYTNTGKVDGWNPFSEVQMVAYYLSPSTDGGNTKTLVRAVTRNLLPVQDTTPPVEQVLLPGVAAAEVFFYDGTDWVSDWDSTVTTSMPTAAKFRLTLAGSNVNVSGGQIELVVPIMVTTTASAQAAAAETGGTP